MLSSWRSLWSSSLVSLTAWRSLVQLNLTWPRRFNLEKRNKCKQIDLIWYCRWSKTGSYWKLPLLLKSWNRRDYHCSVGNRFAIEVQEFPVVVQGQFLDRCQHPFHWFCFAQEMCVFRKEFLVFMNHLCVDHAWWHGDEKHRFLVFFDSTDGVLFWRCSTELQS